MTFIAHASAYSPSEAGREVAAGADPSTLLLFITATGSGLAVVAVLGLLMILRRRSVRRVAEQPSTS
jgi:hypothetical protein